MGKSGRKRKPRVTLKAGATPERLARAQGIAPVFERQGDLTPVTTRIQSTIDRMAKRGDLTAPQVDAANRLEQDYYASTLHTEKAVNYALDRVDGGQNKTVPDRVMQATQDYIKAGLSVPVLAWPIVKAIVIDGKGLQTSDGRQKIKQRAAHYSAKEKLIIGLDELTYHYGFVKRPERKL